MAKWLLLEPAYYAGAQLKGAMELDDAQHDVQGMLNAGLQLRNITLNPLSTQANNVVTEIRQAQAKGHRPEELIHLFAALSFMSDNGGGGGGVLSDANPQPVGTVASPGVNNLGARDDHVHDLPFATVQSVLAGATGPLDFNGQQLVDVANPTAPQAAATKDYVDTAIAGAGAAAFSTLLHWSSETVGVTTTTRFLTPGYGDSVAPINAPVYRVTQAGVLRYLRVKHNIVGSGGSITYAVLVNGVPTGMTCTFNAGSTDGNDLLNFASVVPGDEISIRVTKGGVIAASPLNVTAVLSLGT